MSVDLLIFISSKFKEKPLYMRKTGANDNADNSKLGTSSVMSTKGTGYAKGRPSSSSGAKKSTNEFISGQLDPDKIDEYVYPSLTSICSPKI